MKDFISKKRNDNFIIDSNSEYFFNKEISYNSEHGYNPHVHMVILTNKKWDSNNKQFQNLIKLNNIDFHIEDIYKRENSFLKSLECILHYINKFDVDTARIQSQTKILKGEHSNKHSKLFDINKIESILLDLPFRQKEIYSKFFLLISFFIIFKKEQLQQKLYNKIIEAHKQKTKEAKAIFKRNANKKHLKNYIRLLKSLRKKLHKLKIWKFRQIHRLKAVRPIF